MKGLFFGVWNLTQKNKRLASFSKAVDIYARIELVTAVLNMLNGTGAARNFDWGAQNGKKLWCYFGDVLWLA